MTFFIYPVVYLFDLCLIGIFVIFNNMHKYTWLKVNNLNIYNQFIFKTLSITIFNNKKILKFKKFGSYYFWINKNAYVLINHLKTTSAIKIISNVNCAIKIDFNYNFQITNLKFNELNFSDGFLSDYLIVSKNKITSSYFNNKLNINLKNCYNFVEIKCNVASYNNSLKTPFDETFIGFLNQIKTIKTKKLEIANSYEFANFKYEHLQDIYYNLLKYKSFYVKSIYKMLDNLNLKINYIIYLLFIELNFKFLNNKFIYGESTFKDLVIILKNEIVFEFKTQKNNKIVRKNGLEFKNFKSFLFE